MIADVIIADEGWSRVDQACADNLLMGIITDSGSFRYPSTSAQTLYTAARLMEVGAEPSVIH